MNISPTRFTALLILVLQWLAIAGCLFASKHAVAVFTDMGAALPELTQTAIRFSSPSIQYLVGGIMTLDLMMAECLIKSERLRFLVQIVTLSFWLSYTVFVLVALWLPLAEYSEIVF